MWDEGAAGDRRSTAHTVLRVPRPAGQTHGCETRVPRARSAREDDLRLVAWSPGRLVGWSAGRLVRMV
jgi:hypothetical protein